ncbi:hypothetical protein D3790_15100 [Xenorhabdus nematophila]|nr:hypothetical protein D3790_15100 [Xenorhabdus nematophila]KHD28310.1 hypothetical protein LH67_11410 [Xenorhabdus nematophila]
MHRAHAAQSPRNKRKPDVKRTTPHPPARFGSKDKAALNYEVESERGLTGYAELKLFSLLNDDEAERENVKARLIH